MPDQLYTEFEWQTEAAGNGASCEKLTKVFVRLIKQIEGVRSICDLGCGNGHLTGELALAYDVAGVDASASGIQVARRAYPNARFIHARIDSDLNGFSNFDLVVSSDVIEHLYRHRI